MKRPRPIHSWDVTPARAIAIQKDLASRVSDVPPERSPRLIGGLDAAFTPDGKRCVAAAVIWDMAERRVVEERTASAPLRFPYVPGLLSFREAPALLAVLEKVNLVPDALMCDGQGLAHPRRFGIASHMGLLTGLPSIGCAKSVLVGEFRMPGAKRGCGTPLMHKGERVGTVLRTRDGVKPVFVSIGHRMDLRTAERIVLACGGGFRLPEPTRLADHAVTIASRA